MHDRPAGMIGRRTFLGAASACVALAALRPSPLRAADPAQYDHPWIPSEAFLAGLKKFYADNRFKKAGTDDLRRAMEAASGKDLNRFFERWIYDNGIPRLRYSTAVEGNELVARFEQSGDIFDVPVTVAVTYSDGKTSEFTVIVNDATNVAQFPLTGPVRSVDVNPDGAAIAIIEKK